MRTITLAMAMLLSFTAFAREAKVSTNKPKPLSFIENRGQVTDQYNKPRKDIDVKLETPGMNVFVGDGAIHYQWYKVENPNPDSYRDQIPNSPPTVTDHKSQITNVGTYRMDVELVGANKNAEVVLEEKQEYYETYYLPQFPDGALAHSYNKITYKNVYPGIDWVLYSNNNQLKYDFVVQAGADPKQIRLKYNGATTVALEGGNLVAKTPFGIIAEDAPYTYRAESGEQIASSFRLDDKSVAFNVAACAGALVIDPTLEWATYYGGTDHDHATGVCSDRNGDVYIVGTTLSATNIATAGAFQATILFGGAGFVAKFNAAGARQWGTYYCNSANYNNVGFNAICSDGSNVYATGDCSGPGLATPGAFQTTHAGTNSNEDAILVKFTNNGQRIWATYFGTATGVEIGYTCFADTSGVYFSGNGNVSGLATPGAFQTWACIGGDFLAKFSLTGVRLWTTYFSGHIGSITGYKDSVIYIGGFASNQCGNIATSGSHQATPGSVIGGYSNGFLARFTTAGARVWATYYGGSSVDQIGDVATDPAGFLYAIGSSWSTNNIATSGTFQPTHSSTAGSQGFIVKFDPSGVRQWGTYTYLGPQSISSNNAGLVIDSSGRLYLSGSLQSNISGFASPNATQTTYGGGGADAFVSIYNNAGWPMWNTYYGGSGVDHAGRPCYAGHRIYIAGGTASTSGIATTNGHQTSYGGGTYDGFLAQFKPDTYIYLIDPTSLKQLCKGDSAKIRYGTTGTFNSTNIFTVQLSNAAGSFVSPTVLGTKAGMVTDSLNVYIPTTLMNGTGYKVRVLASSPADTSYDLGITVTVAPSPAKPVATATNPICTGQTLAFAVGTQSGVAWSWTGPNSFTSSVQNPSIANVTTAESGDYIVTADLAGCARKDTVSVNVGTTPAKPTANNNGPICAGTTLNLTSTTTTPGVTYSWSGPMGYSSTQQNPSITAATPGHAGDYIVTASLGACHAKDTTTAVINSVSSLGAYASPNDTFCEGTLVSVVAVPFNGGTSPTFQWYKNGTLIPGATGMVYSTSSVVTGDSFYCRMIATGICTDPLELYSPGIKITVLPVSSMPSVTISSNPVVPQPGQLTAFTATAVNGGPTPTYQWLRNGQLVVGATGANWSASTLHPYDQVSCVVFSSDVCANPKTDTSSIIVVNFPTTIKNVDSKNWQVYPNPATSELTIEGEAGMQVSILNVLGQELYGGVLHGTKAVIDVSQFVAGHYVLQLIDSDGTRIVVKLEKL